MQKLTIALKKQRREIERLKRAHITAYRGFGRSVLCFDDRPWRYPDGGTNVQEKLDQGHYESIRDFDGFHTADIAFPPPYRIKRIGKYQYRTKQKLRELGKSWRERASKEFPGVEVSIVVHQYDGIWFLDTFNYQVEIEGGIYL
jgi:hypothetical protein